MDHPPDLDEALFRLDARDDAFYLARSTATARRGTLLKPCGRNHDANTGAPTRWIVEVALRVRWELAPEDEE